MSKPTKKTAYETNQAIEALIAQRGDDPAAYTSADRVFIGQYSGYGGLDEFENAQGKGLLYEFYTPETIIRKMWSLALLHGFKGGKVLEPSAGIGDFLKYAPGRSHLQRDAQFMCVEVSPMSAKILRILYPQAMVKEGYFEQLFINDRNESLRGKVVPQYDLVVGNPPYGNISGRYFAMGEDTYSQANQYDEYFILRGLDLLHPGGLLVFIVGAEVANGGSPFLGRSNSKPKCKEKIAAIADLIDAYRLPNGVFDRTDVLSDIIIFRKK